MRRETVERVIRAVPERIASAVAVDHLLAAVN
jgi:hypothetical protein